MIEVSAHAAERFAERIGSASLNEARAAILSHDRALTAAVAMGCKSIRLGNGARLILEGSRVVTVYPPENEQRRRRIPWGMKRERDTWSA